MSRQNSTTSHPGSVEDQEERFNKASDEEKSIHSHEPESSSDAVAHNSSKEAPNEEKIEVEFDHPDKDDPRQWKTGYKIWVTIQLGMLAFTASLASSITSPADDTISKYVGVSNEVGVLAVSLYM